jgi:mannose/fructose/N-acetylgalactosamine-specific phosphotransferase system component IID
MHKEIVTADLLRVLGRSFLIQSSWSYERMQSLGFAYAIEPVLRKLYPDRTEYEDRLRLHMEYFNTQPYLASFILGAVVRLEQDRASEGHAAADIQGLKESLMAPLGALGDSFFWGSLKPVTAIVAVALLLTGSWWAPILYLVLYNTWHLGIRAGSFFRGYRTRGDAVDLLARYRFTSRARAFKVVSLIVLGGMIGAMPVWRTEFRPAAHAQALSIAGMAFTLVIIASLQGGNSPIKLMLGLAALCLALAYAGVI